MTKVTAVGITKPLVEGVETADEFIAYVARVSNPGNQMNHATAPKLIRYCFDRGHWSVFETVFVTMEVETTRDISHQMIRHRSFTFQEFSGRYADPAHDLGFVTREARLQDRKNRQNSIEVDDQRLQVDWVDHQKDVIEAAIDAYDFAMERGIAKEQARAVLPEGCIRTKLYMTGSLRSWLHYVGVRSHEGVQKEHREVALLATAELYRLFPTIEQAMREARAETDRVVRANRPPGAAVADLFVGVWRWLTGK